MKKDATRQEYSAVIMGLIYFAMKVEPVFAREDLKHLEDLIDILKFYYQFATND